MAARKKGSEPQACQITVGCCGFPVPPTRYFQDFGYVEVQDVTPGMGTIRRWKREAPPTFTFAVIAMRDIGQEGYRDGTIANAALDAMCEVMKELNATTGIFVAPPDFVSNRANKSQLREFLTRVRPMFEQVVFEPNATWDPDETASLCGDAKVIAARDPLAHGISAGAVGYYRMPGPAGYKSRYEDPVIEKLAALANSAKHERATYVFANVDMFADAKRFRKLLKP